MVWKPGVSGNPAGRPKGHKDRFRAKFWADYLHAWEKHGPSALERMALNNPDRFVATGATLLPRDEQRQEIAHKIEVTLQRPDWLQLEPPTIDVSPKLAEDD